MSELRRPAEDRPDVSERIWDEVLKGLPKLESEGVRLRFGLGGNLPLSVDKIAATLKINRERVRQIESKALSKLDKLLHQSNL